MKRRDFLASMGAAGVALSAPAFLSACGGGGSTGSGGSNKVAINWWHIQTQDPGKADWQNLANQYMKLHPNVKINITVLENASFKSKLTTVMQSGNPPDLFHSWGGGVLFQYAKAGLVQDLTPMFQSDWGKPFNQSAVSVYSTNGRTYGAMWDMGAVGFFYNKALFAKAGITQTSQLPTTWTDFLQLIQKLKNAGITPLAIGAKEEWPSMFYWIYLAIRTGGKDAFLKAYNRTGSFADQPFVQAGQLLQQLVALQPFQKGFLGSAYTDEQTFMGNGKAAMELQGQWAPTNDKASAADKKGPELGFFPFPMVEGGAGNPTDVLGGGGGISVGKNAPPETLDFLKFLITPEHEAILVKDDGALPPMKGVSAPLTPIQQQIVQLVSQAPYFQLYYDQFLPPSLAQVVLDSVGGLVAGTASPAVAAQQIESGAATALH